MTFPESAWLKYINMLSAINNTAAKKFTAYLNTHDVSTALGRKSAIDYAYALATQYGETAAAAACEMYDAVAEASGIALAAAEPAATAAYGEVAKAVNGLVKQNMANEVIGESIGRLVKRAGADTTLKNAKRDGAEFAWIPHGDTCAFCLMLASNGWQKASSKTIKGDHAEHIHANCDCTFAVRFDGKSDVGGYVPDKFREMYDNAEGDTWQEKLNSMRREQYAASADEIRAQKREAYARNNPKDITNTKTVSTQIKEFDAMNEYDYFSEEQEKYRFDEIKKQTGFNDEKTQEVLEAFSGTRDKYIRNANAGNLDYRAGWCYGQDSAIRAAKDGEMLEKAKLIDDYIKAAPKFDGEIYRGMSLPKDIVSQFEKGGTFTENGNLSSWSSAKSVAQMFAEGRTEELGGVPVILETVNSKYSTPISHLSIFSREESEVIVSNMHKRDYIIESVSETDGIYHVKLRLE